MRAAFPGGLHESVPKEVLFGALRLEVGVLEDRLYTMLERARPLHGHAQGLLASNARPARARTAPAW